MLNAFLMEQANAKVLTAPVDLNTAAVTGGRIAMKPGFRVALMIIAGTSTAAVAQFSLKQHNAASSGTTKALSIANPYFHKLGAATVFTKVDVTSKTDAYDLSTLMAADGGIVVFEVLAEDLDVQNNFTHVSVDIADSTAAKLATVVGFNLSPKDKPAYLVAN